MPITESHKITDILKEAEDLFYMFDLTQNGLGTKALKLAAEGVRDCFSHEEDPDGNTWASLSPSYEAWKTTAVGSKPIGYLYGIMSDMTQIEGIKVIASDHATMTYGTNDAAVIEAMKFQEGGAVTGTNQPRREFYGFSLVGIYMINNMFDDHFQNFTP